MKQVCRLMSLIFCAGLTAFGQAVPSQIGNVQVGNGLGNRGAGDVQVIYAMTGATNHGWNGYLQFNMGVFPALTPAQVQKATLSLYLESGGGPGTVALCEAATAWSATTITERTSELRGGHDDEHTDHCGSVGQWGFYSGGRHADRAELV